MSEPDRKVVMMVPWAVKEAEILASVNRRGAALMWAAYGVYALGCIGAFLAFGDKPVGITLIMILQFLMVIWMGTRAMYTNMSAMLRLSLETNREMMPTFERLATAVDRMDLSQASEHLRVIRESLERATRPMGVNRRPEPVEK